MKTTEVRISKATLRRLPRYYGHLKWMMSQGREVVSCTRLADKFGCDASGVRKDLEAVGVKGRPRVGFDIADTLDAIEEYLGWKNVREAVLVGAGKLGLALMGYHGFAVKGLKILCAFDSDSTKAGREAAGLGVYPMEKLSELTTRLGVRIGVLCVPYLAAQSAADAMVAGGVKAIWNFTPAQLDVGDDVIVENVDLSASFAALSGRLACENKILAK